MNIVRFSAVENFGVPIDNPVDVADESRLIKLMRSYSIKSQEVSTELTDITPYYWQNPTFRYFLSRRGGSGPAVVDLMPRHHDSSAAVFGSVIPGVAISGELKQRTFEIPTEMPTLAIMGPGPRFIGQICVHELILPS